MWKTAISLHLHMKQIFTGIHTISSLSPIRIIMNTGTGMDMGMMIAVLASGQFFRFYF
jgi:hypothetical protein